MSQKDKSSDSATAEEVEESTQEQPHDDASRNEELTLMLEDARAKADEHYTQLLRLQAELENVRKRTARDLENAHKFALEKFMAELLPVRDSLELGLAAAGDGDRVDPAKLKEGVELTLKMFADAMAKFGAQPVDPQGQRFNPELHQAMSMQEAPNSAPNTVLTVVQKGYQLNERLLRPALVIVSSGGRSQNSAAGDEYQPDADDRGGNIDEQA